MIQVQWEKNLVLCFDDDLSKINVSHLKKQHNPYLPNIFVVNGEMEIIDGEEWYKTEDVFNSILYYPSFRQHLITLELASIKRDIYMTGGLAERMGLINERRDLRERKEEIERIKDVLKKKNGDFPWSREDFLFNIKQGAMRVGKKTYLALNELNDCKIGCTEDLKKRQCSLRVSSPNLFILAFVNRNIEKYLHKCYEKYRIKREWFKFTKTELQEIIRRYNFILYETER